MFSVASKPLQKPHKLIEKLNDRELRETILQLEEKGVIRAEEVDGVTRFQVVQRGGFR